MNRRGFYRSVVGLVMGLPILSSTSFAQRTRRRERELQPQPEREPASRGLDPFIGEVILFAGNFAPRGWAFCNGQLLQISSNQALFSIIGTIYGGDGRTTFGLPDLRGRVPVQPGTGPGLTTRQLGQRGGAESVALAASQMPSHSHTVQAFPGDPNSASPIGKVPSFSSAPGFADPTGDPNHILAANAVSSEGGGQAHENMQPFLGLNYIIALVGVFPSRS